MRRRPDLPPRRRLDRHGPAGLAMTRFRRHCENAKRTKQSIRRLGWVGLCRLAVLAGMMALGAAAMAQDMPHDQAPPETGKTAILQALDKITARLTTLEVAAGSPVRFGTLEIAVMTCHKRPPEEPPETTAFLIVDDHGVGERAPDEAPARIFSGWMFASSPGISALEHPVYDLWVIDCKTVAPSAPPGSL